MSEIAAELRRIADQIERWARYDDVPGPGLDEAETLRRAADLLSAAVPESSEQGDTKIASLHHESGGQG